jgi:5-methyltetrahydropteroyltriglutamate--homocysteine methyltransferase
MPAARTDPPFRADHVGSLLRPREITRAFKDFSAGRISADEVRAIQDRAIRDVVALQEAAGIKSITDGEFRRASYWSHFVEAVDGLDTKPGMFTFHKDEGGEHSFLAPTITGRVARAGPISAGEFEFLKSATSETPKITMPSPPTMHFWSQRDGMDAAYTDIDAFIEDLSAVYREEIADLAARGARYVQLDEVPLAMLCDPNVRDAVSGVGEDPDELVDSYVKLFNRCLEGRPAEMTVAMHLCRGNYKGQWLSEGGYDAVAERLFNEIDVDAYFMEYDTERAGDFAPLRHLPAHKIAVLGLISTKSGALEDKDDLRRRIDEAATQTPLENLAISPQCGFASTVAGNPVTLDDEKAKLALVVEVAESVWG